MITYILALNYMAIATEDIRRNFPVGDDNAEIVADAFARAVAAQAVSPDGPESNIVPIVVNIDRMRCVVLLRRAPSTGGNPSYCYRKDDTFLEYSMERK